LFSNARAAATPLLLSLALILGGAGRARAQAGNAGATSASAAAQGGGAPGAGPRKQLATIVYAGLGGAILGLSTLSFYGRPQDKLSNIAIGFAIGVISGTSYVTYKAASNPAEFYGLKPQIEREMELAARASAVAREAPALAQAGWTWEF
jgi:hypothetical protein